MPPEVGSKKLLRNSGGHSKVEPPGPVPNPEVKHFSADGSWAIGPVRVGRRQVICPLQANACSGLFLCQNFGCLEMKLNVTQKLIVSSEAFIAFS